MSKNEKPAKSSKSEAAAETRKRRGRPKVTDPAWEAVMRMTGDDKLLSRRTIVNHFYRNEAVVALRDAGIEGVGWLINNAKGDVQSEILVELGRLGDVDRIREAAAHLCRTKPRSKEAVAMIRRWRTGRSQPGDAEVLAMEIGRAIEAYQVRYPATDLSQIRQALDLVRCAYSTTGDSETDAGA